jgi:SAM-dependent methyltransferase
VPTPDRPTLETSPSGSVTPKLRGSDRGIFRYYAGFSSEFVVSVLNEVARPGLRVLDPWNGSGTTTRAAMDLGLIATGVDISPLSVVVAAARLERLEAWRSIRAMLPTTWPGVRDRIEVLETWLSPAVAACLRGFERTLLRRAGVGHAYAYDIPESLDGQTAVAALLVAAVTRKLVVPFATSNPTWIKLRVPQDSRLTGIDAAHIRTLACQVVDEVLQGGSPISPAAAPRPALLRGDSRHLPVPDSAFDIVVTSPPYCTRLDYVVATLPELAAVGIPTRSEVEDLRGKMLGSPSRNRPCSMLEAGSLPTGIRDFLKAVANHETKAASGYYLNFFSEYFARYAQSIRELARALRGDGRAVLVVQDSHFKDIPVSLRQWTGELLECVGFRLERGHTYPVPNPKALNPAGRRYRASNATEESVVIGVRG